jgi:sodium/bile acid cotransporter 7
MEKVTTPQKVQNLAAQRAAAAVARVRRRRTMSTETKQPPTLASRARAFALANFLVLGFCFALILGLSAPVAGRTLGDVKVGSWSVIQTVCVVVIFVISGATLKTEEIAQALTTGRGGLAYGLVAILGLTPLLGFIHVYVPYKPVEFRYGLALFSCVPTTLTSGVTLVRNAKGNVALALMLTVCTNLLGVFTVPFYFNAIVSSGPGDLDTGSAASSGMATQAVKLLVKLLFTILVPIVCGKLAREMSPAIASAATKYKAELTLVNNSCLITIVWMSISKSATDLINTNVGTIFAVLFAAIVLHVVMLVFNYGATALLGFSGPERVATVMMSSQKTLPVAMTIISYLPEDVFGSTGLIAIPCIVCHITQLFMDAPLATRLAKIADAKAASAAASAAAV